MDLKKLTDKVKKFEILTIATIIELLFSEFSQ